jgi:hypothetical protein
MKVQHLLKGIFTSITFLSEVLSEVKQPLGLILKQTHQKVQVTSTKWDPCVG